MREFNYKQLKDVKWDINIINLLTTIHESKGRQELYLAQKPDSLNKLVELAKVQSTEASNAIEGIRTTDTRLRQLVSQKTTPKNRNEEEIAGYRDALNTIHESFDYIPLTPNYILQLHKILYSHNKSANFGGQFKNTQNYIQATDEEGNAFVLFTPLAPYETPDAIVKLCDAYNEAIEEGVVDPLILIPIFIHDFLCIHPFRDGNGRMSRLLTTLLLYRSGYFVGKYISLEAKISKYKDLYYDALSESQNGWHQASDDPSSFVRYILNTIADAYSDFESRFSLVTEKLSAQQLVETAFFTKIGKVTKSDIMEMCPTLSASSVEKAIAAMVQAGKILKEGSGRNTFYIRNDK